MTHPILQAGAAALVVVSVQSIQTASAQTPPATHVAPAKPDYRAPRTSFGQPSFEGVWTQNFIIMMEATSRTPQLVIPEAEAAAVGAAMAAAFGQGADRGLDPEVVELMKSVDGLPLVRGERRTRAVVLPADGKIPFTPEARKEAMRGPNAMLMDSYEVRPNWERCVTSLGLPPVTGVGTTSVNPRQFIQLPDRVVIHTEYGDEARIIPLARTHGPKVPRPKLGDSIAWWEGETLVIETIDMPAGDRVRFFSNLLVGPDSKVIERFTRVGENELLYQYTIEDPSIYTAPWLAEYSLYRTDTRMFEHACHEGNHSLPNILLAARLKEKAAEQIK